MKAQLERRLDYALSSFEDRIGHITVSLSGGRAPNKPFKRCEIEVVFRPRSVRAEDTDADLFVAVQNAAARLKPSVVRALERERAWAAGQPPLPKAPARK